jgi:hypothetical protein
LYLKINQNQNNKKLKINKNILKDMSSWSATLVESLVVAEATGHLQGLKRIRGNFREPT